jgi:hypothetical protein
MANIYVYYMSISFTIPVSHMYQIDTVERQIFLLNLILVSYIIKSVDIIHFCLKIGYE